MLDHSANDSVTTSNGTWILTDQNSSSGNNQSGGGGNKVLYNTTTHQVLTPAQIQAGGTGWTLLDANNSSYSSYVHPAYYNTTVHQVLDHSANDSVTTSNGTWILTDQNSSSGSNQSGGGGNKVLYNTTTHQVLTPAQIQAGGTGWTLLDANNSSYSSYVHPAYYNTTVHQVLDHSANDSVTTSNGTWILTDQNSSGQQQHGLAYTGPYQKTSNFKTDARNALFDDYIEFKGLFSVSQLKHDYNTSTYFNQSIDILTEQLNTLPLPPSSSRGDAVDQWITANFDSSNKFDHQKTLGTFDTKVISKVDLNNSAALRTLASNYKSIYFQVYEGQQEVNASKKILYNPKTRQSFTPFQVQAGGTDWSVLNPNQFPNYSHPAYYNISIHRALDQSKGDTAGDWILSEQVLYDSKTHQVVTQKEIAGGASGWMILDPNNQQWSNYNHPAYYNTTTHNVLDQNKTSAGGWMITGTSSGQSSGATKLIWALSIEDGDNNRTSMIVDMSGNVYSGDFNTYWFRVHGIEAWNSTQWHETHYNANTAGIESMLLAHPVIFDPASKVHSIKPFDFVADAQVSLGSQASLLQMASNHGKIFFQKYDLPETGSSQKHQETLDPLDIVSGKNRDQGYQADGGDSKVLYNTSSHQVLTKSQVQSGNTGWSLLESNSTKYANYSHPAYYNFATHQILENKPESKVGDWILTNPQSGSGQNSGHVSTDSNGSTVGAFMPYTGPYTTPTQDLRLDVRNALFDDLVENKGQNSVSALKTDYKTTKAFNDSIDALVNQVKVLATPPSTARGDAIDNWIKDGFEQVKNLDPQKEAAFVWALSLEEPKNNGANKLIDMHGNVYDTDYESYWLSVHGVATHKDPNWSEVEYTATSSGIAKLLQDYPFVDPNVTMENKHKLAVLETDIPLIQGNVIQLSGMLRETNGTAIMQVGFLVSTQGHPTKNDPNTQTIPADSQNNIITASHTVTVGGVYYIRSFAETISGFSEGPVRKIEIFLDNEASSDLQASALSMIRKGTKELSGGWRESSWFGLYLDHGNGWIYHQIHGYLYLSADGGAGIWAYDQERKWFWSTKELYPHIYQADQASWLYMLGVSNGKGIFFNYGTNRVEF